MEFCSPSLLIEFIAFHQQFWNLIVNSLGCQCLSLSLCPPFILNFLLSSTISTRSRTCKSNSMQCSVSSVATSEKNMCKMGKIENFRSLHVTLLSWAHKSVWVHSQEENYRRIRISLVARNITKKNPFYFHHCHRWLHKISFSLSFKLMLDDYSLFMKAQRVNKCVYNGFNVAATIKTYPWIHKYIRVHTYICQQKWFSFEWNYGFYVHWKV